MSGFVIMSWTPAGIRTARANTREDLLKDLPSSIHAHPELVALLCQQSNTARIGGSGTHTFVIVEVGATSDDSARRDELSALHSKIGELRTSIDAVGFRLNALKEE